MKDINTDDMSEDAIWFINRPSLRALRKKEINKTLWDIVNKMRC